MCEIVLYFIIMRLSGCRVMRFLISRYPHTVKFASALQCVRVQFHWHSWCHVLGVQTELCAMAGKGGFNWLEITTLR